MSHILIAMSIGCESTNPTFREKNNNKQKIKLCKAGEDNNF